MCVCIKTANVRADMVIAIGDHSDVLLTKCECLWKSEK